MFCSKQVPAVPIEDEFLVQAFEIEANRPAQEDVEILKRDMHGMREMQVGEPGRGRGRRRGQFDPVEIGSQFGVGCHGVNYTPTCLRVFQPMALNTTPR